jgi:hypothetical protein
LASEERDHPCPLLEGRLRLGHKIKGSIVNKKTKEKPQSNGKAVCSQAHPGSGGAVGKKK